MNSLVRVRTNVPRLLCFVDAPARTGAAAFMTQTMEKT